MAEDSQQDDQTQDDAAGATPASAEASTEDAVQADAAGTDESDAEASRTDSTATDVTATTATAADPAAATRTDAGRTPVPATSAPQGEEGRPNRRKVREGLVMSIKMDKTAVVGVVERVRHPRYVKTVQRTKKLYAHDPQNDLRVGDRVRVAETRPLSRLKRWRVVEVLERAK
jgi:small subunit ribosomal protein S17